VLSVGYGLAVGHATPLPALDAAPPARYPALMTPQALAHLAAIAWPIPMVAALAMVATTRTLRFRVLWCLVSLIGVGAFWMEISTGRWGFIPFAINLLGPGHMAGFHKAVIPLGAVIAIVAARRARRARAGS
jgi:hypothetical protein